MRIGTGWDSHRLQAGRALMIGGAKIPSSRGEIGHSDGDVLLHAVIDALLGAAALGDIGSHFPPSDPAWKDADSKELLQQVCTLIRSRGYEIGNIDTTVILEKPKLAPFIEEIRTSVARNAGISLQQVSVKAKSAEGLGPVGEGLSIEASAAALIYEESGPSPDMWV